ncbi:Holliday junction branch migration protein RuvA [Candidatus Peregrinibacteria bacterium]|nr:MAG: Holliday junction branch migration protein RuvA [Candidatus Peregrinibacteria bacterium]
MISFISGKCLSVQEHSIIVLLSGLGLKISVPDLYLSNIQKGKEVQLYTYFQVRETEMNLYGFFTQKEKSLFELLISVSGIGPKMGLAFFAFNVEDIISAILMEDVSFLNGIKGIGKKTAERMIVELKNKIAKISDGDTGSVSVSRGQMDVIEGLMALGFDRQIIINELKTAPEFDSEAECIEWFLKKQK